LSLFGVDLLPASDSDERLVEQVVGEGVSLMLVGSPGAGMNVALSVWNFGPAEPGRLLVVARLKGWIAPTLKERLSSSAFGFLIHGRFSG